MCQLCIEDVSIKPLSMFIDERIVSPDERKSKNENPNYIVIKNALPDRKRLLL